MERIVTSTKQTEELANELAKELRPKDVVALYGDLGSGKTTFTSYLVKALGFHDRVQSPTFVILRIYFDCVLNGGSQHAIKEIKHFDLYRLLDISELDALDFEAVINEPAGISIIEWPEIAEKYLPENVIKISFEYIDEDKRKVIINGLEIIH